MSADPPIETVEEDEVPNRRISIGLTRNGRMDVSLPGLPNQPVEERTLEALRALGEAALDRMERYG